MGNRSNIAAFKLPQVGRHEPGYGYQQRTHGRGQGRHDRKVAHDQTRATGPGRMSSGIPGTVCMVRIFDPIIWSIAISVSILEEGRGYGVVRSIIVDVR